MSGVVTQRVGHRTCVSEVAGSVSGLALHSNSNLGQVVYTL